MLLLLGFGWYHTAHRVALLQWTTKVFLGGSYFRRDYTMWDQHQNQIKVKVSTIISSATRVEWQTQDKEPINTNGGAILPHIPSGCLLAAPRPPESVGDHAFEQCCDNGISHEQLSVLMDANIRTRRGDHVYYFYSMLLSRVGMSFFVFRFLFNFSNSDSFRYYRHYHQ